MKQWRLFSSKKFKESLNTCVYTTVHVLKEGSPILLIAHELDGDWQFMGIEPIEDYTKTGKVVGLNEIIDIDKSVLKIADMPIGHCAKRESKSAKWIISKIEYSSEEVKEFGFYCSECGKYHKEIPLAYSVDGPYKYFSIPEDEREKRCVISEEQCVIDDKFYFIRGRIEIGVESRADYFNWNIWVEITKNDFDQMSDRWEDTNRILDKPYSGKLANKLEPYPNTLDLPVIIYTQPIGYRPKVELSEINHPLFFDQSHGINMDRITFFAKEILYKH